jgi:hypothetical protein
MSPANWKPIDPAEIVKPELSGTAPKVINPEGHVAVDRVITSSGETPTGGEPVGGHADRVQPSYWARKHGSASGALDPGDEYDGVNDDVLPEDQIPR